jgi:hypothetical protein
MSIARMLLLREFGGWLMLAKKVCGLVFVVYALPLMARPDHLCSPLLLCQFGLIDAFPGGGGFG